MTRIARTLAFIVVALAATGCATLGPQFQAGKPVPAGKALVYVYRESSFIGGGIAYMVRANGTDVSTLPSGGYFEYAATPGEIEFSAKTEAKTSVTIDAKAGNTYYVKGTIGVGFFVGHPHLVVVPNDVGAREIAACKLASPPPAH